MRPKHWFLPQTPDVLGMLREQTEITIEAMDALVAWTGGDADAADSVRRHEHRADACKRELRQALTIALTTPLDPEDIFELSRSLDEVLNGVKDTVREAEVMRYQPDPAMGEMAQEMADGTRHLAAAFDALAGKQSDAATEAADAAVKSQRHVEHVYRRAMSALIQVDDLRVVAARRELYRRLSRASDQLVEVAERVWYSVLKQG